MGNKRHSCVPIITSVHSGCNVQRSISYSEQSLYYVDLCRLRLKDYSIKNTLGGGKKVNSQELCKSLW